MGGGFDSLGDAFGGLLWYVDAVSAIVIKVCANVPAVNAMTGTGAADGQDFIEKDSSAGWCKGRAIQIVGAVELGFGGNLRVDAVRRENIESGCRLGNKAAP